MNTHNKYSYKIFTTEDSSQSIFLDGLNESFHSKFGAIAESNHIYIETGLNFLLSSKKQINILEVGFGTGLNALITYKTVNLLPVEVFYHAIEPYPLNIEFYSKLNYPFLLNTEVEKFFFFHECNENEEVNLSDNFKFFKSVEKVQLISLKNNFYDLVYFDAFNPDLEPEIWSENVFEKIYTAMSSNSVLVTYSTKGIVKRAMKKAGFLVEKLAGPKGKREICRALKK